MNLIYHLDTTKNIKFHALDTDVKRVSQLSTESREFSPGTPVSSHREC